MSDALIARARQAFVDDDHGEMIRAGDALLARDPTSAAGLQAAASAFFREERFGLATVLFNALSQIVPADPGVWNDLGCALKEWRPGAALECFEKALELRPGMMEPTQNLVTTLSALGRFQEAADLGCAILQQVDAHEANDVRHNLALAFMQLGRWSEAWPLWEAATGEGGRKPRPALAHLPRWKGEGSVAALIDDSRDPGAEDWLASRPAKVVVHGEQGLGDEIMMTSVLDLAVRTGAEIILECEPRLEGLFRRSFPKVQVYGTLLDAEPYWLPIEEPTHKLESLGLLGLYAPEPFRQGGWLVPDGKLRSMFRAWLDALGPGLKVGLSWSGGFMSWERAQRTIPIDALGPIVSSPGCQFISLEYNAGPVPAGVHELPWATRKGVDFDLTAALIAELDLVVSVPQTVVDAAGAIGTHCMVLVPPVPNWRFAEAAGDQAWIYRNPIDIIRRVGPHWSGAVAKAAMNLRTGVWRRSEPRAAE